MTDDITQQPAAPGTDTGGTAPPPAPPAPASHEGADASDFDLLADDGGDDDADAGDEGTDEGDTQDASADADADRPAWQRPDGLDGDELTAWKEQQGLPTDADGYDIQLDLREGERITDTGQQLIDGLKEFAVEHDLPPPAVNSLVKWYDAEIKAQNAKLAESDKTQRAETRDVLSDRWGNSYAERIEIAREGSRVLPQALRAMLKDARTPDGRRIAHTAEFAQAMFEIGRLRTRKGNTVPTSDDERLAQIESVMRTNIDAYRQQGLDKKYLGLMRRRDEKPVRTVALSPAEEAEERELVQLMETDINTYAHRPYAGTGKPAADRLLALRRKRAGEAA